MKKGENMAKVYEPAGVETRIYKNWEHKASDLYSAIYETLVD